MSDAVTIGEDSVPRLPRGVKLRFDKQRDQWVVLAPERVFVPDPIALEIIKRCDGEATVGAIVDDLAKRRHYYERFVYSQKFSQIDPWEERVNGKDAHEFAAMAEFGFPQAAE